MIPQSASHAPARCVNLFTVAFLKIFACSCDSLLSIIGISLSMRNMPHA